MTPIPPPPPFATPVASPDGAAGAQTGLRGLSSAMIYTVLVTAFGYAVDLYDLVIFGVVRMASLRELGLADGDLTRWGVWLLDIQMVGLLLGGLFWGWLGDRFGRRPALIGAVALYSAANLASSTIGGLPSYAALRFLAGFGLAGELGAGLTLITESLPPTRRGYGATVVATVGLAGAAAAAAAGKFLPWRTAFLLGGALGLVVLAARLWGLHESEAFLRHRWKRRMDAQAQARAALARGERPPFQPVRRLITGMRQAEWRRVALMTLVAMPIWYVSSLFITFTPEFASAWRLTPPPAVADALLWQSLGLVFGAGLWGVVSERLRSRRAAVAGGLGMLGAILLVLWQVPGWYLPLVGLAGVAQGYWTPFMTLAAEQFPLTIRATYASLIPNLVRATTVPVTLTVQGLAALRLVGGSSATLGWVPAAALVGVVVFGLAAWALTRLPETWGRELLTEGRLPE